MKRRSNSIEIHLSYLMLATGVITQAVSLSAFVVALVSFFLLGNTIGFVVNYCFFLILDWLAKDFYKSADKFLELEMKEAKLKLKEAENEQLRRVLAARKASEMLSYLSLGHVLSQIRARPSKN